MSEQEQGGEGSRPEDSSGKLRSGVSAAEAGRLSGEARRAKRAKAQTEPRPGAGVVVAVDEAAVVKRLTAEAEHGNVQAARELREWLDRAKQDTDDHGLHLLDVLTPDERDIFMGWMLAHETPAR